MNNKINYNFNSFDEYAMKYDLNIERIAYKYNHSYRVEHQAEMICHNLNLSEEDMYLASLISLLHDIARFRQWMDYETFHDEESFDHGEEAIKILFEENEIKNYDIDIKDYEILKKAIKNHNKYEIEPSLTERELLHSEIVRDADKLDIFYAISTGKLITIDEDDEKISNKIKEEFFKHNQIDNKYIESDNDRIIRTLSMVYDINFDYSKQRILQEKYLEKIYQLIKNKKLFKPYFEEAKKYLKGEN